METSDAEDLPLRILIADDSVSDRLILKTLLRRLGHDVVVAANGLEAIRLFRESAPDMVLLDALMPELDGMAAAREIKKMAGERMVPLIFLTSLSEADALAQCLDAGGDDFLSKPYNRVIIQAKVKAFNRMRLMHQALAQQRDVIREHNRLLTEEQQIAKRVFDNVAHTGCLDADNIRYHASPLSIFNGDVLFASPRPAGGMLLFIGDFTGHGLPAAIGAMPVAEIFYGMASKGFSGSDVLLEINQKLKRILPTGMFCCGAMIEADFKHNQLQVWNGGLPDGWLIRADGGRQRIPSRHLPLGILTSAQFDGRMEEVLASPGDRLLLMTDGLPESTNSAGELFGDEGVVRALDAEPGQNHPMDLLLEGVRRFTGSPGATDDLTLCCLEMTDEAGFAALTDREPPSALSGPSEWQCVFEIRDQTLAEFSPLPLLLHICMEVPGLRRRSGDIYILVAELYSNALEHGVLELPSQWKASREGFDRYYEERRRRLDRVEGHFIRFTLHHTRKADGGRLRIVCEDSGQGFDYRNHPALAGGGDNAPSGGFSGRGLALLKSLSDSVSYYQRGNRVEIIYDWELSGMRPSRSEQDSGHCQQ